MKEIKINPELATCAFIYDHAGGLLSATIIEWENEEDGIQFHRQEFNPQANAVEMFKTLPQKSTFGWIMTRSGRVRAFVSKITNARIGTLYDFLEYLEKTYFSERPTGVSFPFNPKAPRS